MLTRKSSRFKNEENFWTFSELDDLCDRNPQLARSVTVELVGRARSENEIGSIAAGPLEDLIRKRDGAELTPARPPGEAGQPLRYHLSTEKGGEGVFGWLLALSKTWQPPQSKNPSISRSRERLRRVELRLT
jgi:hypothetical protein